MSDKAPEIQEIIKKIKESNRSCEDKCLDLKSLKLSSVDGEIDLHDDFNVYYFKTDPEKPKDPKVVHAARQFCKIVKVPYSFFAKNPEYMREKLAECWIPSLKSDKAQVLAKVRKLESSGSPVKKHSIRAMLPVEFTNASNADILSMIADAVGDDFKIEFVFGDDWDDLILHARFISSGSFDACGERCSTGFSVVMSELGATPLVVETLLFRDSPKTAFIASHSGESYFRSEYSGIQADDLKALFPKMVEHLKSSLDSIRNLIQSAKEVVNTKEDTLELMKSLRLRKGLSEKFHTQLFQEIDYSSEPKMSLWDFANKVSLIAKDYDAEKRVRIERVAGDLIGLKFEKA